MKLLSYSRNHLQYLLISLIIFLSGCDSTNKFARSHPDISTFVGNWVGEDRKDNILTTWIQKRFTDGTYTILFIQINNNEVTRNIESGKWWLENNKFYEINSKSMEEPDIYTYKILNKQQIHFKNYSGNNIPPDYEFIDKKIEDNYFDTIPLK